MPFVSHLCTTFINLKSSHISSLPYNNFGQLILIIRSLPYNSHLIYHQKVERHWIKYSHFLWNRFTLGMFTYFVAFLFLENSESNAWQVPLFHAYIILYNTALLIRDSNQFTVDEFSKKLEDILKPAAVSLPFKNR